MRDGSIDIGNESPNALGQEASLRRKPESTPLFRRRPFVYPLALKYGERPGDLYPVRGRGDINAPAGYIDQRWTAPALPIAAAVDLIVNSPSWLRGRWLPW